MIPLKTSQLIIELSEYDFYSWDEEENTERTLLIGMSDEVFQKAGLEGFYDSWGFEAVNNPHASPSYTVEQWGRVEEVFFGWLESIAEILKLDSRLIVTPKLTNWWTPFDIHPPKWTKSNKWFKGYYESYISLLENFKVIKPKFSLQEDLRGVVVENFDELKIIGKMAVKNTPFRFFFNKDRVIMLTEYLTILIECKDVTTLQSIEKSLSERLSIKFFRTN